MASARLIRRASNRGKRTVEDVEQEPLLSEEERLATGDRESNNTHHHFYPNPFADLPVYDSIWRIRRDILDAINDPYSYDQLRAPRLNTAIVRPLLEKYYSLQDLSIVFCLLVNRSQFLKDQSYHAHYSSVRTTRALLCEILALRLLRQYDEDSSGADGLLLLANIVIAGFDPFQNCPKDVMDNKGIRSLNWAYQDRGGYEGQMTALEVAIISESKLFLSSGACQKVVDSIYTGRIVYTPTTFIDILPDTYKHKPISIYDPKKAPRLNTYRLSVPRIRNILEIAQFITLLVLYVILMTNKTPNSLRVEEIIFIVYTLGWILDTLASMLEHGWQVYSQNLWSFLDVTFSVIFLIYLGLRVHGLSTDSLHTSKPALDILAMGAPFLVPRLAFNIFSENLLFVSLRDMMSKFLLLTFLAVWSFAGFFLSMIWLNDNSSHKIPLVTTGMWMVWVWFGLDGTGIEESHEFHWLLGPLLMVAFAILGNTLFLTILVSTLSDSFAKIARYSTAEIQFRRAVLTFEGVKSDAIFAYWPPFNILALAILLPLKLVLSPRWFHKVNIAAVRILNAPVLVLIGFWERRYLWPPERAAKKPQTRKSSWANINFFRVHGDIQAVFESPPPGFVNKSSDILQARRRKSWRVCAPGSNEEMERSASSTEPISDLTLQTTRLESAFDTATKSLTSRRSSFSKRLEGNADVNSRLERIEEMLEQIGHSMDETAA